MADDDRSFELICNPIPFCVDCRHHVKGHASHRCTRERKTQLDVVTGVYVEVSGSVKECANERGTSWSNECCGRTGRFFEGKGK